MFPAGETFSFSRSCSEAPAWDRSLPALLTCLSFTTMEPPLLWASHVLPGLWLTVIISQLLSGFHQFHSAQLEGYNTRPQPYSCQQQAFPHIHLSVPACPPLINPKEYCYCLCMPCFDVLILSPCSEHGGQHQYFWHKLEHWPDYMWMIRGFLIYKWVLFPRKL